MDWDKLKVGQIWETDSLLRWMKVVRVYAICQGDGLDIEVALECFGEKNFEWVTEESIIKFIKLLKDAE